MNNQAQEAAMSLPEYEDFVYSSCLADKRDSISEWKKTHQNQRKICSYLDKTEKLRFIGEDTDLTLNIEGRKWINCGGDKNMPDGEVFTGPGETSAEGTIRFCLPRNLFRKRSGRHLARTIRALLSKAYNHIVSVAI